MNCIKEQESTIAVGSEIWPNDRDLQEAGSSGGTNDNRDKGKNVQKTNKEAAMDRSDQMLWEAEMSKARIYDVKGNYQTIQRDVDGIEVGIRQIRAQG